MELETTTQLSPSVPRPVHTLSIAEQRANLAEIKAKIILYKDCLLALETEERELEDSLALLVYPIITLPNEITTHIFVACLPEDGRVMPSPRTAPLLLAQICRQWRNIALSTGELWRSVHLVIGRSDDQDRARLLFDSWLSRARGHPLSLGLNSTYHAPRKVQPEILTSVSAASGQIKSLELDLTLENFDQFYALQIAFPRLQHLATSTSQSLDKDLQDLVKRTPFLRQVRLICRATPVLPDPLLTNLLTSVEIHRYMSAETFRSVLDNFPLLTHVKCRIEQTVELSPRPPTRYPHLHSLSLSSYYSISTLDFLTLPNLHHLELLADGLDDSTMFVFRSFLARSLCALHHLTIGFHDDLNQAIILECLATLQSVEVLNIRSGDEINRIVLCLNDRHILPRLRHITINSTTAEIDHELLVEMLRWRWDSILTGQIKSCHLNLRSFWDEGQRVRVWPPGNLAFPALKSLVADGLEFALGFEEDNERVNEYWPNKSIELEEWDPLVKAMALEN
ncbi:hypothetical protein C8R44DRAFT_299040 [Mycena epipterygia]|nr:hypothetical protein C8R44DRAFT_299040 [Mycena epipterygia]